MVLDLVGRVMSRGLPGSIPNRGGYAGQDDAVDALPLFTKQCTRYSQQRISRVVSSTSVKKNDKCTPFPTPAHALKAH